MKLGIQKKLAFSLSIFFFAVLGASCWGIVSYSSIVASRNIQEQQFAMAELIAGSIDDKLGTYLATIAELAVALPPDVFEDPDKARTFLESHRNLLSVFGNGLLLCDDQLSIVAETPDLGAREARIEPLKPFLKAVAQEDFPEISDPYLSAVNNAPAIAMAVPVTDRNNRLRGFLVGSISLTRDYFLEEILGYKIGRKGHLYLLNTDRTTILHPDKSRIMKQDNPPGVDHLLDSAVVGFEGSGETVNSQGVAQIASFKRLKMVDWILAAVYPQEEAYAPIQRLRNYLFAASSVVALLSLFLTWLLTSTITSSLNSFTSQVRHIRSNPGSGHEIRIAGSDEVALLADTFNGLMRELDLTRESLDEISRTDHLTGLYNRRHLEKEAPKLIAISERQKTSTAVLMLDIDHFKRINDAYGHEAGDAVLVHFSRMLLQAVRPYDIVVRHGGEEFILLLPLTTRHDAMEIAERLRIDIQNTPVRYYQEQFAITASIGVYVVEQMHDLQQAMACADAALYEAKNSGRNRVCLSVDCRKGAERGRTGTSA